MGDNFEGVDVGRVFVFGVWVVQGLEWFGRPLSTEFKALGFSS